MNTGPRISLTARLFYATIATTLIAVPITSRAQNTNTATGINALYSNTTGAYNTADGYSALQANTAGGENTATGIYALYSNTTGSYNEANGFNTLCFNTTGNNNTANGSCALYYNTTGTGNTATGINALFTNRSGNYNTANGFDALYSNSGGNNNTADGFYALYNATGHGNIALGYGAGRSITTGSNNIAIGNPGSAGDSGAIRIGTAGTHQATLIAGINGVTLSGATAVFIDANGQLGTITSSQRFKHDIKAMGSVSDKLMKLRPVTFRYNDAAEKGAHHVQYGLIAEEVAKVYPNLVQYDRQGKPFTIYYHLLTPMLLNELQREHQRNEAQNDKIVAQQAEIGALKAQLASLQQTQEQQSKLLTKLAAYVQTAQNRAPLQNAVLAQH